MVGLDPGLLWAASTETLFDESRPSLSLLISKFEENVNTRPGESASSAPRLEPGQSAPPSGAGDVDDTLFYPQYFSYSLLFFCSARLEQSIDRVGIRYTRHWSLLMEPSQFLRLLQFRCSRFVRVPTLILLDVSIV